MFDAPQTHGSAWRSMLWTTTGIATALGGGILLGVALGLGAPESQWLISLPALLVGSKALDAIDARPRLKARLRAFFGGAGSVVADQVMDDHESDIWNTQEPMPETITYRAAWSRDHGWQASRAPKSAFATTDVIRGRVSPDGRTAFVARTQGGKMHAANGQPAAASISDTGRVTSAAWYDCGVPVETWRMTDRAPLTLDIEPEALATMLAGLADEAREANDDWTGDRLDRCSDIYWQLSQTGHATVSITVDAGMSNLDSLEQCAAAALSDGEAPTGYQVFAPAP